jgi:hypothetical protein
MGFLPMGARRKCLLPPNGTGITDGILERSPKSNRQLSLILVSHFIAIPSKFLRCRQIWRRLSHGFRTIWNAQPAQAPVTAVNLLLHCMSFYDVRVALKGKTCQEHDKKRRLSHWPSCAKTYSMTCAMTHATTRAWYVASILAHRAKTCCLGLPPIYIIVRFCRAVIEAHRKFCSNTYVTRSHEQATP